MPIAVVMARREFEAWFLAAAGSLGGRRGLPGDVAAPPNPEDIRGAKEWLSQRIPSGAYSPAVDQASLAAVFDLELARGAPSFDKCYRDVVSLLEAAQRYAER